MAGGYTVPGSSHRKPKKAKKIGRKKDNVRRSERFAAIMSKAKKKR